MTMIDQNPQQKNAALGKDAKHVGKSHNSYSNYELLSHAQKILIGGDVKNTKGGIHRTRLCSCCRSYQAESISIKLNDNPAESRASLGGVQTCANVWTCPVCAPRIAMTRRDEVKKALEWARVNDYMPIMVTLTARHHRKMRLDTFKDLFKEAWRKFTQSQKWRGWKRAIGAEHAIKSTEVTHGKNGWHYHYHILIFCDKKTYLAQDREWTQFAKNWVQKLHLVGLSGIDEYAFDVRADTSVGEDYLTKLGMEETKASYELTSEGNKDGSGSTQWQLLRRSQRGDAASGALFVEFAKAMQGEFWIYWSDNFKSICGVDSLSDEVAAEEDTSENFEAFMSITDEAFKPVRFYRAQAELLEVAAATRSERAVNQFLDSLRREYRDDGKTHELRRMKDQYAMLTKFIKAWCPGFGEKGVIMPDNVAFQQKYYKWHSIREKLKSMGEM